MNEQCPLTAKTKGERLVRIALLRCCLILVSPLMIPGVSSLGFDCKSLSEYTPIQTLESLKPTSSSSGKEWSRFEKTLYQAAQQTAQHVFESYLKRLWNLEKETQLSVCIGSFGFGLQEKFQAAKSAVFFRETLSLLERSPVSGLKQIAKAFQEKEFNSFKFFGHFQETNPNKSKAGFHRGRGSIFMDLVRIPPEEWELIFVHEALHSLDSFLLEGMKIFGNPQNIERMRPWLARPEGMASTDQEVQWVSEYLEAGLNRGFLAECRAWALTFQLYQEGRKESAEFKPTFQPLSWMEEMLSQKTAEESYETFAIRILDPGFIDPKEGIFENPKLRVELLRKRISFTEPGYILPMGSLKVFSR